MDKKVKNRKLFFYTTLEIVVILIMTIVGNMWDWVNMQFDPAAIATGAFWEDTFIKATLYSGSLVLAMLLKLSKLELKDGRYDDLLNKYRTEKLPAKNNNETAFARYIEKVLNPQIKKEYIRTMLNTKLYKIQKHEKDEWLDDYFKIKDLIEANPEYDYKEYLFSSEKSKIYFIKRTRIEAMLQPEFIDKHYLEIRCKYPRVSTAQFGYYLEIKRNKDERYKLNNEVVKDISKQAIIKVGLTFLISMCLTIMALQPATNELLDQAHGWVVLIIKYIIRVIMICLSFATGIWTAKSCFNDNYLLPLINRNEILDQFKLWLDINPVKEKGVEAIKQEIEEELRKEYESKLDKAKEEIQKQAMDLVKNFNNKETVKGPLA